MRQFMYMLFFKTFRVAFLLYLVLFFVSIQAQQAKLVKISTTNYPEITLLVEYNNDLEIEKDQIRVFENDVLTTAGIKKVNWLEINKKNIAYLFEYQGGYTPADTVITHVLQSLQLLNVNDKANLFYYGFQSQKNYIYPLCADFSSNMRFFEQYIPDLKLQPTTDSLFLCKALNQTFDFITLHSGKGQTNVLFFMAKAREDFEQEDELENCIEKAKASNTKVYAIIYEASSQKALDNIVRLTSETGGQYSFQNQKNTLPELEKFIDRIGDEIFAKSANLFEINFRIIDFQLEKHQYEIRFHEDILPVTVVRPIKRVESFWQAKESVVIIGVFLVTLFVLGSYLYRYFRKRKKNIQKQHPPQPVPIHTKPDKSKETKPEKIPTVEVVLHDKTEMVQINKLIMNIGRNPENDLVIADPTVSGFHAVISNENNVFFINDNNSTNGVLVNSQKIQKTELKDGDTIRLGIAVLKISY